ncbi:hypothetical protein HNP46_000524 [Pseudomonas nitritireducens]|uniref:Uncharacterized protein n=1 Tax=Pseudomonas nitroreducens TaxID=46680 RepID=A0A7W7NYG7_PSENT|nr:hypothetical protein [Pseudomonas nitritireducens]MBB4861713.1 hypothetical protein [Pseudomonas nitritireducens]
MAGVLLWSKEEMQQSLEEAAEVIFHRALVETYGSLNPPPGSTQAPLPVPDPKKWSTKLATALAASVPLSRFMGNVVVECNAALSLSISQHHMEDVDRMGADLPQSTKTLLVRFNNYLETNKGDVKILGLAVFCLLRSFAVTTKYGDDDYVSFTRKVERALISANGDRLIQLLTKGVREYVSGHDSFAKAIGKNAPIGLSTMTALCPDARYFEIP